MTKYLQLLAVISFSETQKEYYMLGNWSFHFDKNETLDNLTIFSYVQR